MATRRSCTASASPARPARLIWKASRRNNVRVCCSAYVRNAADSAPARVRFTLTPRLADRKWSVINLAEDVRNALRRTLFQVDILRRPQLQRHSAIPQATIERLDALIAAHIQVVGQPQQRNQTYQRALLIGIQSLVVRVHVRGHGLAMIAAE